MRVRFGGDGESVLALGGVQGQSAAMLLHSIRDLLLGVNFVLFEILWLAYNRIFTMRCRSSENFLFLHLRLSIQSGDLPFDRPSSNHENFQPLCTNLISNINSRPMRNVVATITTSFMFHHHAAIRRFCIPSLTASSHRILETGAPSDVPEEPEHLFLLLIASSHRMGASANTTRASNEVAICSETLTGIR